MRCKLLAAMAALALAMPADAQLYGISNGFGNAAANEVYQIDPSSGAVSNVFTLSMPGFTMANSLALAADPMSGTLYAVLQTTVDTNAARRLVTVDPNTGVCTNIGTMGVGSFATLAFRSNGTLYGVTGQAGANPETLFTINPLTAATTLQFALGNGADGETIAFHPNGLLYHSSGNSMALFESVNVDTMTVTPIGTATTEMFAMGFHPGLNVLLGSDIASNLFSIDIATGARTLIGNIPNMGDNRGLAFVTPVPEPTSMALAGVGLAGFMIRRRLRRKVVA